ncbi:MAG: molybdopterin-binding protein [Gammaproteobacteria bacterium]|nr:molybdopterin-binding protein [Gammaproteobacteria bacterium]
MDSPYAGALSVGDARARIHTAIEPVVGDECVALRDALSRILYEPICSPINVPSHTNSAVDGYAIRGADLSQIGIAEWDIVATVLAGRPYTKTVESGEAVRIMTGAKMPLGADTVIMQEHVELRGDTICIGQAHRPGENVRAAGEDLAVGDTVLRPGKRLTPADLGLLGSLGIAEVRVRRTVRVAFFSTGDELRSIGEIIGDGEIYDSNRYTLYGMLTRSGVELIDMGVVRDRPQEIENAFRQAADCADVVITSGGVSVGEADYVTSTLENLGQIDFWKIAMKPGRPLAFGRLGDAVFFGLPGNPVAVMVTFYQFVQPALMKLMGWVAPDMPPMVKATCRFRIRKKSGRTEFTRGIMSGSADGYVVESAAPQGSGILRSMSAANCFIVLPHEQGDVEPGMEVEVQPFAGLI